VVGGRYGPGTSARPPVAGKGRLKGAQNKLTRDVKAGILGALNANSGQKWLEQQAAANPVAFMALLAKVLPAAGFG
jgi:hypothetical protein